MSVTIKRISEVSDPNVEAAAQILADGYRNNPVNESMIGGHGEFRVDMFRGIIPAYILGGKCYVALDSSRKVVGIITWYPPGSDFLRDEPSKKALEPFFSNLKTKYPDLHEHWNKTLLPGYWAPSTAFAETSSQAGNFKQQNWNAVGLATLPGPQKEDVEQALIKVGLDEAKKTGGTVCGESSDDAQYQAYLKAGFRVLKEEQVIISGSNGASGYLQRSLIFN